jgi:molybdopterin converting factor small subunit
MTIGDKVEKLGGDYTFAGVIVADFTKLSGQRRFVVEDDRGVLHIYSEAAAAAVLSAVGHAELLKDRDEALQEGHTLSKMWTLAGQRANKAEDEAATLRAENARLKADLERARTVQYFADIRERAEKAEAENARLKEERDAARATLGGSPMSEPTPEERAYDVLNRVGVPGWGDDITKELAAAIRAAEAAATERAAKVVDGHADTMQAMLDGFKRDAGDYRKCAVSKDHVGSTEIEIKVIRELAAAIRGTEGSKP